MCAAAKLKNPLELYLPPTKIYEVRGNVIEERNWEDTATVKYHNMIYYMYKDIDFL